MLTIFFFRDCRLARVNIPTPSFKMNTLQVDEDTQKYYRWTLALFTEKRSTLSTSYWIYTENLKYRIPCHNLLIGIDPYL